MVFLVHLQRSAVVAIVDCPDHGQFIGALSLKQAAPQWICLFQRALLAIGTAKELVETCCKTILSDRSIEVPKNTDLPKLVKLTCKELDLTPANISDKHKASETIRRLLSNLATITQGVAELRNDYGTGHGREAKSKGLTSRHAKLAVGAASTLAVFLIETHSERTTAKTS